MQENENNSIFEKLLSKIKLDFLENIFNFENTSF